MSKPPDQPDDGTPIDPIAPSSSGRQEGSGSTQWGKFLWFVGVLGTAALATYRERPDLAPLFFVIVLVVICGGWGHWFWGSELKDRQKVMKDEKRIKKEDGALLREQRNRKGDKLKRTRQDES